MAKILKTLQGDTLAKEYSASALRDKIGRAHV